MHILGHSRAALKRDHYLQTPDTFVRAPLPGMHRGTAIVHAAPAIGAGFSQYTAEMEEGGTLGSSELQRFLYVLEGELECFGKRLGAGGYAYGAPNSPEAIVAVAPTRVTVIDKRWSPLADPPASFVSAESQVKAQPLMGDSDLQVRVLLPDLPQFDFAVNTMMYAPGASLSMVEMHVMEHGLLMLEGGGIYRLGDSWYPVTAGDFIYMGPFCPQWFGALGKTPAKYLIYKDWNRHPDFR